MVQNSKGSKGQAVRSVSPATSQPIPLISWENFKKANRKKKKNTTKERKKTKTII